MKKKTKQEVRNLRCFFFANFQRFLTNFYEIIVLHFGLFLPHASEQFAIYAISTHTQTNNVHNIGHFTKQFQHSSLRVYIDLEHCVAANLFFAGHCFAAAKERFVRIGFRPNMAFLFLVVFNFDCKLFKNNFFSKIYFYRSSQFSVVNGGAQSADATGKMFKSIFMIMLVQLLGWGSKPVVEMFVKQDQDGAYGSQRVMIILMLGTYPLVLATALNAPILYYCRLLPLPATILIRHKLRRNVRQTFLRLLKNCNANFDFNNS